MPKRTDIASILVIGAGPIIIGQACEFDYSGAQAIKALKQEGYRVILANSNPATIMTDPELAHRTYIEPITAEIVARIIVTERPDALLPTMGGQTALNIAMELHRLGVLERHGVEMIGARPDAIAKAEDRELFRRAMEKIGLDTPRGRTVRSREDALLALEETGLPAIIRPSFTLGGTGGGIAADRDQFLAIVESGLRASPVGEVLIEESIIGWKEYEMEVVRDRADNGIIVCSIENIDPMGVHTGDSITVAPALTLTDKEYQRMRNASLAVLREIGVDTGGANVQFAVDPRSGRQVVIEMNPRVSRSSALASKATGYPIAKIAAKLAVGYTLDELRNDIAPAIPASFEPTIDYVVVKIPRFAFEKFPGSVPRLGTAMKSVGEAMAIGRSFPEALQKAYRSLETGLDGLADLPCPDEQLEDALTQATPERLLYAAQALRRGWNPSRIAARAGFDPWFLEQIGHIVAAEQELAAGPPQDRTGWARIKELGFSDRRIAQLTGSTEDKIAQMRLAAGIQPVYKRIDSCAGEFPTATSYFYSTYQGARFGSAEDETRPSERTKILILGGGPNRIGQGIEFDYCCVHACYALKEAGYETVMINCNPETVSTDYDTADRLYFDPLTSEDVLAICRAEQQAGTIKGAIVQLGGQTPLKLAASLEKAHIPILGTSPAAIDLAEDREQFQRLLEKAGLRQPNNRIARSAEEALREARLVGYPLVARPSYVLGGRAMEIVHSEAALADYMRRVQSALGENVILLDSYLQDAIEVDVDALADGEDVYIAGIMEHIEEAGIHSGDSACTLPPHTLPLSTILELRRQTEILARALGVVGLMNVQFAIQDRDIYVLEVNPRASRTVPFVAKATGVPIAKIGARIMAGEKLSAFPLGATRRQPYIAVKEAVFPFSRFPGADVILGPEMKSTGEVMGLDRDFERAFAKAQAGAGARLPSSGTIFVSVKDKDKPWLLPSMKRLLVAGFDIIATPGTAAYLRHHGLNVTSINKVHQGGPHILSALERGEIALVFNTTSSVKSIHDSQNLRRTALMRGIPYYTTLSGIIACAGSLVARDRGELEVQALQSYFNA
ncbi:MAG TPA: carbamoyl-phosphate synthase large subunit [Dongiaceae bacterium]|nr:carbamoyl-phosphate synthase large subunit [Dongiaceae bacterium]